MRLTAALLAGALGAAVVPALAQPFAAMDKAAIRAEIKARCQNDTGQYGETIVLACMRQDWAAAQHIRAHRGEHEAITKRCLNDARRYGYAVVEACIRQDNSASRQIDSW